MVNHSEKILCFLVSQKRLFFDIVDRQECFLDLRREILKAQKNGNFPQKHFPGLYCLKKKV